MSAAVLSHDANAVDALALLGGFRAAAMDVIALSKGVHPVTAGHAKRVVCKLLAELVAELPPKGMSMRKFESSLNRNHADLRNVSLLLIKSINNK
jgi:hypothetical protein